MNNERYASVWHAIEDTPGAAENMKVRSALIHELVTYITNTGMTQSQAARQFGVTQPRISDLTRGKIDLVQHRHPRQYAHRRRPPGSHLIARQRPMRVRSLLPPSADQTASFLVRG